MSSSTYVACLLSSFFTRYLGRVLTVHDALLCLLQPTVEALNVFYHLTYEGAIDIDRVPDPSMKAAVLA
jgi:hypothetical protein